MSGRPTWRETLGESNPADVKDILGMLGLGTVSLPSFGANGSVTTSQAFQMGGLTVSLTALVGDGAKSQFTIAHNLGKQPLAVRAYLMTASGAFGQLIKPRCAQYPGAGLTQTLIMFAADKIPAAGVQLAVAVIG